MKRFALLAFLVAAGAFAAEPSRTRVNDVIQSDGTIVLMARTTRACRSLHWLQDQGPVVNELRSFHLGMSTLTISPLSDDARPWPRHSGCSIS